MAVAKTGAMFKSLTFDGFSSRDYGVYITGEAVYNAPERAVEMISIPNRNGAFALDQGHFENIKVTYPAGVFADNEADFADAISDFRNLLCSRKGYCTLTDEYHPDEYREAVYKSGLEVTPSQLRAGEFTITFECKPQRFLNSGSTEETVTSGGTITNPTLFDAKPQLRVKGYGVININSDVIEIENIPVGLVVLEGKRYDKGPKLTSYIIIPNLSSLNNGDAIEVRSVKFRTEPVKTSTKSIVTVTPTGSATNCTRTTSGRIIRIDTDTATFSKGTSGTFTASASYFVQFNDNTTYTSTQTVTITYDGVKKLTFTLSDSETSSDYDISAESLTTPYVYGDSTKTATGNPAYIDLDIGEAWNEDGGEPVSIDNAVILPAKLPVLSPGVNTITYDNTVTSFKIVPRWWKI